MESSGKHRFLVRLALRGQCLFLPYCPGFAKATRLPDGLGGDRVGVAFFRNQLPFPRTSCLFPRQTMLQATTLQARRARVVLRVDHSPQSSIGGMVQLVPRKWPLRSPLTVQRIQLSPNFLPTDSAIEPKNRSPQSAVPPCAPVEPLWSHPSAAFPRRETHSRDHAGIPSATGAKGSG